MTVSRNHRPAVALHHLAAAGLLSLAPLATAFAQPAAPSVAAPAPATPVEMEVNSINDRLACRPQEARLPAGAVLDLRIRNNSDTGVLFAAPEFFAAAEVLASESTRTTADDAVRLLAEQGRVMVPGGGLVRLALRAPRPGTYGYACRPPGEVATIASTGFLVVVPPR